MTYQLGFILSAALLVFAVSASLALCNIKYNRVHSVTPVNCLFIGTFLSATVLFLPIYSEMFAGDGGHGFKTALVSVHNAIRLFVVDSDFSIIDMAVSEMPGWLGDWYAILASVIFVLSPILTFGFILSFFKNISAYIRLLECWRDDIYVFSELDEKSLTLAASIRKEHRSAVLIFSDVYRSNTEESVEMVNQAKALGVLCFKKDILSLRLSLHSRSAAILFFVLGPDQSENMKQMLGLIAAYKDRGNTHLYVFTSDVESELLVNGTDKGKMKVRRIDEVRSLIYRTLYEHGGELFDSAIDRGDGSKQIGVVIVGMGSLGSMMLRSLAWYCQMDNYEFSLDAIDADPSAESRLTALCPELMSDKYNGTVVPGEARYRINVHSNINVETDDFSRLIAELGDTTYVFVALGNDELNIATAVKLRMLFERIGARPVIRALVKKSEKCQALQGAHNYRGVPYNIDFFGDIKSSYCESVILDSDLEKKALEKHMKYSDCEEDFWAYEYNYRSSLAAAIHTRARIHCGITGAEKKAEEMTDAERAVIEPLEHRRWNAYMRSEGYISTDNSVVKRRNDIARVHTDLVSFYRLSEADKRKDSQVGSN